METFIYILIGLGILVFNAIKKSQENASRSQGQQNNSPKTNTSKQGSPQMVRKPAERPEYPVENQRPIIFERENSGRKVLETIEIHKILSKTEQKKLAEREMPKILTYEERAIAKREQNLGVYSEEFLVREALRTDRAIPDHKHGDHHGKRLDYDAKTPVILTRSQKLLIEKNRIRNAFMIKELLERKEF